MSEEMVMDEVDALEVDDKLEEVGDMRGNRRGWEWMRRTKERVTFSTSFLCFPIFSSSTHSAKLAIHQDLK